MLLEGSVGTEALANVEISKKFNETSQELHDTNVY
jgi:hypothetical protein